MKESRNVMFGFFFLLSLPALAFTSFLRYTINYLFKMEAIAFLFTFPVFSGYG